MFTNSEKEYEEIVEEIDVLATSVVENYIKFQEQRQKFLETDNKDRNNRTFE